MKKKTLMMLGGIFVVLLVFIYFAPSLGLSLVGATPIACTQPQFLSSDTFYNEGSFMCTMVASGSGKYLEATFSPQDAESLFGVTTTNTAKITVEVLQDDCRYEFQNESIPVKQYDIRRRQLKYDAYSGWGCRKQYVGEGWTLLGNTPAVCSSTPDACNNINNIHLWSGCDFVLEKTAGVMHRLDPSVVYDYQMEINMTASGQKYSSTITQDTPSVSNPAFRAELLGALLGQQSCPSAPDTMAFIENVFEPTPIEYHSSYLGQAVYQSQLSIVDVNTALMYGESHNTMVNNFLASPANLGQYCSIASSQETAILEAQLSCDPVGTVAVPVFNLYMNAETLAIGVPEGNPEIVDIAVEKITSADRSEVTMTVTNNGESDSFDASLKCNRDLSPFSSREYIETGETVDITINYEGAGVIDECIAEVHSVGSPQNADQQTVRVFITPFCPRTAPSANHETVFTEYGCAFICPEYGEKDVNYPNCQVLSETGYPEDYDRCIYDANDTCYDKKEYAGIHCTGIGAYRTTERYMDKVNDLDIDTFIPKVKDHKYFIVEVNGQPVCDYVNEYGFDDNGNELNSLEFDYAIPFPEGTADEAPPSDGQPPSTTLPVEDGTLVFIILGIGIVIALGYIFTRKKRR